MAELQKLIDRRIPVHLLLFFMLLFTSMRQASVIKIEDMNTAFDFELQYFYDNNNSQNIESIQEVTFKTIKSKHTGLNLLY